MTNKYKKSNNYYPIILTFLISITGIATAKSNSYTAKQNEFLQAYQTLNKGGLYYGNNLQDYILYPYLDYERIKQNLKKTNDNALIGFINNNQRSWMADDLRSELMSRFAQKKNWREVLRHHNDNISGYRAKCLGIEAKARTSTGNNKKKFLNQGLEIWLSGNPRPEVCTGLFNLLKQHKLVNDRTAWQRIALAMDKGKTRLAKNLSKHTNNKSLVSLWTKLRKNPSKHLNNSLLKKNDARTNQVIVYGIKRLARKNTYNATDRWIQFQKTHHFTIQEKAQVESYIGVRQALDQSPYALQNLAVIPAKHRSEEGSLWMARRAIRQGDWHKVLDAIRGMTDELKKKDIWQYWQATAEKKTGKPITINRHKLAENASFYGFLAADELKIPYKRLLQKETNWQALIPKVKNRKSMQRATELFAINKPKLAKKEWNWTLKQLDKMGILTAAAYAHEIGQPFLGIITVSKTKDWNQTGLRFPLRYQSLVKKVARSQRIVPAWVYGVMRRESAFDPIIQSHANAKGLMQVLPATARGVAKRLGIKGHRTSDLFIPEKNALIGAGYLSHMLKRFKGNYAKATASYNAGPHRIPRWTPDHPITAPQWIESIPFKETRNYVRAVMSYTTIYDHKLNYKNRRNLRLSQRLQKVGP